MGMDLHLAKPLQINFFKKLIADFRESRQRLASVSLSNPPPYKRLVPCLTSGGVK